MPRVLLVMLGLLLAAAACPFTLGVDQVIRGSGDLTMPPDALLVFDIALLTVQ